MDIKKVLTDKRIKIQSIEKEVGIYPGTIRNGKYPVEKEAELVRVIGNMVYGWDVSVGMVDPVSKTEFEMPKNALVVDLDKYKKSRAEIEDFLEGKEVCVGIENCPHKHFEHAGMDMVIGKECIVSKGMLFYRDPDNTDMEPQHIPLSAINGKKVLVIE